MWCTALVSLSSLYNCMEHCVHVGSFSGSSHFSPKFEVGSNPTLSFYSFTQTPHPFYLQNQPPLPLFVASRKIKSISLYFQMFPQVVVETAVQRLSWFGLPTMMSRILNVSTCSSLQVNFWKSWLHQQQQWIWIKHFTINYFAVNSLIYWNIRHMVCNL